MSHALTAGEEELVEELRIIANADPSKWDDPSDFKAWAQNRARFAIAKAAMAMGRDTTIVNEQETTP